MDKMEFTIQVTRNNLPFYRKPSELTPTEKLELIKQLCTEIDNLAWNWGGSDNEGIREVFTKFTEYLEDWIDEK